MRKFRPAIVLLALIITAPASAVAAGKSDPAAANAHIASMRVPGAPTGPYSGWSEQDKKNVRLKIVTPCMFMCVDAYGGGGVVSKAVQDRRKWEAAVCYEQCLLAHLPSDYPTVDVLQEHLQRAYAEAKRQGSSLPPPVVHTKP